MFPSGSVKVSSKGDVLSMNDMSRSPGQTTSEETSPRVDGSFVELLLEEQGRSGVPVVEVS